MGGACLNGGGTFEECLLMGDEMNRRRIERYPELVGVTQTFGTVNICEYNPQTSKTRISTLDKEDGEGFDEIIFTTMTRDEALNYLYHNF